MTQQLAPFIILIEIIIGILLGIWVYNDDYYKQKDEN